MNKFNFCFDNNINNTIDSFFCKSEKSHFYYLMLFGKNRKFREELLELDTTFLHSSAMKLIVMVDRGEIPETEISETEDHICMLLGSINKQQKLTDGGVEFLDDEFLSSPAHM